METYPTTLPMPDKDGVLVLSADSAFIHNNEGSRQVRVQQHEGIPNIGYWTDPEAWLEWSFRVDPTLFTLPSCAFLDLC